jgi:hypothetical protein
LYSLSSLARRAAAATCACHRSTALPSPVMRHTEKMASHRASTASSPFLSGNAFSAQAGVGQEPTHHWKRPAVRASK